MSEQENLDDILTFDELLEDAYYKAEFDKRLQRELDIKISHPDVKGGTNTMDKIQQPKEGENKVEGATPVQVATNPPAESQKPETKPAADPTAKPTETEKPREEAPATVEPAKEMTAKQFEMYNETLRRVSKTAKTGLQTRYNAFEDTEVKASVRQQVLAGETPDIKGIAAAVVTRLTPKADPAPESKPKENQRTKADNKEVVELRAELALVKAGIVPERLEAAKRLFIAEGGDPAKVDDFVKQYPEWQAQQQAAGGVVFTKAPPVNGRTAPPGVNPPVMNDFEKRVYEARKARGLPT
jgi:hypothetical protein